MLLSHHLDGALSRLEVELVVLLAFTLWLGFLSHALAEGAFLLQIVLRLLLATRVPPDWLSRKLLVEAVASPWVLLSGPGPVARLSLEGTRVTLDEDRVRRLVCALSLAAHSLLHDVHFSLVFFF